MTGLEEKMDDQSDQLFSYLRQTDRFSGIRRNFRLKFGLQALDEKSAQDALGHIETPRLMDAIVYVFCDCGYSIRVRIYEALRDGIPPSEIFGLPEPRPDFDWEVCSSLSCTTPRQAEECIKMVRDEFAEQNPGIGISMEQADRLYFNR